MAENIAGTERDVQREDNGGDRALFVNEYTYTDELIERFARLQVSGKRRGMLLLSGCTLFAVGAVWLFTPVALHWIGLAPMVFGVYALWLRSNMWRTTARCVTQQMRADEANIGRWRRVAITRDSLVLSLRDGREQVYPWSELTDFLMDGEIFAVIFGRTGVMVPKRTFTVGDARGFGAFLTERLYPAGSMGPDTPNR